MPTDGSDQPGAPSTEPVRDGRDAPGTDAADQGAADRGAAEPNAADANAAEPNAAEPNAADATGDALEATPRIPLDLVGGVALLAITAVALLNAGEARLDWLFPRVLAYALGIIGTYLTIRGLLGFGDRTDTLLPILRGRGVDVFVFAVLMTVYV
ncbi:MAG TPA: hypothetical protein VK891_13480, partial [Euzebyales bacterium]|nr:hypothetical protein [Euzebyales bacterium]